MKKCSRVDVSYKTCVAAMRRRIRGIMTTGKQFSLDSCMDMVQGMLASAAEGQDLPLMSEEKEEQHTPHTSGGM